MANVSPKKNKEKLLELIAKHRGNLSAVARALKMNRRSVMRWFDEDDDLRQARQDERERMLDNAEDKLGNAVTKGEAWAVCFTLKTQGKDRGYSERQELTGANGGPVEQKVVVEFIDDSE